MNDFKDYVLLPLAFILGPVILYYFVHYATGAKIRKKQLQLQNQILLHIAKKIEVDKDSLELLSTLHSEMDE